MTTVRLDPATRAILERLSESRGQTRSEVIRDAITKLGDDEAPAGPSALERLLPFVGVADSGGRNLSRETGRKFREILEAKRDARRPG
jgi:Arc/MetJ-type ribon-helix-helix transcriptional regulator